MRICIFNLLEVDKHLCQYMFNETLWNTYSHPNNMFVYTYQACFFFQQICLNQDDFIK